MTSTKDNFSNLYHQNIEEARIKELEEKINWIKIDEGRLQRFKASKKKVGVDIEEAIVDMYSHLHIFQ